MGHVPQRLLQVREPSAGETYDAFLESFDLLGHGFVFAELVRGDQRHAQPPRHLWRRMVPTLALANELRERMLCEGARGLVVRAAFRPSGGEEDSQHTHNAALDIDLLRSQQGERGLQLAFAAVAAQVWREHQHLRCGVGTYAPRGQLWTSRVHLDTGFDFRCWQGTGKDPAGKNLWSPRPAVLALVFGDRDDGDRFVAGCRERDTAPISDA